MNYRKFSIVFFILMFLLIPVTFAGDYELPEVIEDITIQPDGATVISQDIIYRISDTVNGVYRDINLDGDQSITNVSVETPGYYNTVEVLRKGNTFTIKVWLYKDSAKTQKVSDEDVRVIYHYTFNKGVKIYNDIAEFQYKSWSSEWNKGVDRLVTNIHLPGSKDKIEMWYNPPNKVVNYSWTSDDTLHTEYESVSSGEYAEQRILMPTEYFTSTENADVINKDAKAVIEQQQVNAENERGFWNNVLLSISCLFVALMFVPLGIYWKYGREPKIMYNAEYESDMPTNDSPVFVNSLMLDPKGESDSNGFSATLLDLIDKGYFKVISSNEDDTIIKNTNKDITGLQQYQIDIIDFMKKFQNMNSNISLKAVGDTSNRDTYLSFMEAWAIDLRNELSELRIKEYFNISGYSLMFTLGIIFIVLAVLMVIILFVMDVSGPYVMWGYVTAIVLGIESVIMMVLPQDIFGCWTVKGKEFHDKWKNFENYLNDYSLIKEYPPASIQVWGRYLVYATALGCADEVSENMKKYFKEVNMSQSYIDEYDVVGMGYYGGLFYCYTPFYDLSKTPDSSVDSGSFGDIGDIGGGFGGGGGGVF